MVERGNNMKVLTGSAATIAVAVSILTACGTTAPAIPLVSPSAVRPVVKIGSENLEKGVRRVIPLGADDEVRCPEGDAPVEMGATLDCTVINPDVADRIARVTFLDRTGRFEVQLINS